ncbi:MAG: TauD/TfdA family dioxygenase [Pseudomonadota bacterium]
MRTSAPSDAVITKRPLKDSAGRPTFGVEVGGIDLRDADDQLLELLATTWSEHPLVLIRDQLLDEPTLMRVSSAFGELEQVVRKDIHSRYHPQVALVTNLYLEDGTNLGGLGSYELRWHTDQSYRERPATGAAFYAMEVPPNGGDTHWINTVLAYEALDSETRALIDARHGLFAYQMYDTDITDAPAVRSIRDRTPDARHPTVLYHPVDGQPNLYFDPTQTYAIDGHDEDTSEALVSKLSAHLMQPEFRHTHRWRLGDLMLWDNARLLHSREAFDPKLPRLAKRTTIFLRPDLFPVPALP